MLSVEAEPAGAMLGWVVGVGLLGMVIATQQWRRYRTITGGAAADGAEDVSASVCGLPEPVGTGPVAVPEKPMVHLLGPVSVSGIDGELTPQQLAFVTFLACVGEATKESIIDALWDGRPISKGRFPNLLAEIRSRIGRHHLPDSVGGRYKLVDIATDADDLAAALRNAEQGTEQGYRALVASLELIRGVPLTVPSGRYWSWLDWRTELANRLEVLAVDAATRSCALALERGDMDGAREACEIGLLGCPMDEGLTSSLVAIQLEQGRPAAAGRAVDSWESQIRRLGCGEPSPDLRAGLERALDRSA